MNDDPIRITRADHYLHEDEAYEPGAGPGVEEIDADRINVGVSQLVAGMVSLNVRGPDPLDAYGYEFDLTPGSARVLAGRPVVVAAGTEVPKTSTVVPEGLP